MSAPVSLNPSDPSAYLGTEPIGRLIVKFAVPCVVAMVVNSLYNIVDQLFIGHGVGYLGNAATNAVFPVTVVSFAFALLVGDGAAAFYSLRLGAGKREEARRGVGNALVLLVALGAVFLAAGLIFLKPLMAFFGATDAIMPYALDYGGIIVLGLPFFIVSAGVNPMVRASGAPGHAMKIMLAGAILNTILDPLFIFTFGWGVKGAAIATVISQVVTTYFNLAYVFGPDRLAIARRLCRPDPAVMRSALACGLSSFITQLAITVVMVLVNKSLILYGADSRYGAEIPFAALGVVMKVNQVVFSVLLGIAVGAQPIIGYNYGAKNHARARRTFLLVAGWATGLAFISFVLFVFFPQSIVGLFGSEEELYNTFAAKCFRTYLFFSFLNGFQVATGVFLQAMGKALKASIISLSRQFLFFTPCVILFPMHYGIEGILYAGPAADLLSFLLAFFLAAGELRRLDEKAGEELPAPDDDSVSVLAQSPRKVSARLA